MKILLPKIFNLRRWYVLFLFIFFLFLVGASFYFIRFSKKAEIKTPTQTISTPVEKDQEKESLEIKFTLDFLKEGRNETGGIVLEKIISQNN